MKRKRLKKLIKEIEKYPERHDQAYYINGLMDRYSTYDEMTDAYIPERAKEYEGQLINCGTTGCLAGLGSLRYAPVGTKFWGDVLELPDGSTHIYSTYGREVLGLTREESYYLFSDMRTLREIEAFSKMNKVERRELIFG